MNNLQAIFLSLAWTKALLGEVESGAVVYVPRETVHTFKNIGEQPGKLLVFITPAGLEEFFYEIGSPVTDINTPPPYDPSVFEKVMQLAARYHVEVQLPLEH